MRKRSLKYAKISMCIYSIILILIQLPWFVVNGCRYNFYQVYGIAKSEGLAGISADARMMMQSIYSDQAANMLTQVLKVELVMLVFLQIFCVLYIITVLMRKRWRLNIAVCLCACAVQLIHNDAGGLLAENVVGDFVPCIWGVAGVAEFLISEFINGWTAAARITSDAKQREKKEKEERKRRLYFPGKYTKLFYRIIWKNFLYNWKDYSMFILCGIMVNAMTFAGFGIYRMMSEIHSDENFLIGQGLGQILLNAIIPIGVFSVFLIVFVLIFYLKNRIVSYGMFATLGIRRRTLYFYMGLELAASCICSIVLGYIAGNGIIFGFRKCVYHFLGADAVLLSINTVTYLRALGVVFLIYLVAFMATRDVFENFNIISAHIRKIRKEKMPRKALKWLTGIGILLTLVTIYKYSLLNNYEYMPILGIFFIGLFLIIQYGGAWYLWNGKKKQSYLRKLLTRNQLYHKSKTSAWYLFVLSVVHICALMCFSFQIVSVMIAEDPDELYPYDYMCIAYDEDDEFFENLEETYGVEIDSYSMVRVVSTDKTPQKDSVFESDPPQGQHIGISESTYHALKRKLDPDYEARDLQLDEEGNRIYIVHQQDKSIRAQPVDWYSCRKPCLHIGIPVAILDRLQLDKAQFPQRRIQGEEIGSVTGCFRQGLLENLIVFSDGYFKEAQDMWEYTSIVTGEKIENEADRIPDVTIRQGPTKLVLIRAEQSDLAAIDAEMLVFERKHAADEKYDGEVSSYYAKETAVDDLKTERVMKVIVNVFALLTLLVTSIFLFCVKVFSEMDDQKKRAVFLECMGMRKGERIALLKKEIFLFYWLPCLIGGIASLLFIAATFHARMYTMTDIWRFAGYAAVIWAGYLLILAFVIWCLERISIKKTEGKDEK